MITSKAVQDICLLIRDMARAGGDLGSNESRLSQAVTDKYQAKACRRYRESAWVLA